MADWSNKEIRQPGASLKQATARKAFMSEKERDGVTKAMKAMTKNDDEGLYTESHYNTTATDKERKDLDKRAHKVMRSMYSKDKSEGKFENIDFDQYINVVSNSWFDEVTTYSKEDDPDFFSEAGAMLNDMYEGDVDQFKLSAKNYKAKKKSRANISIKAPGAEAY